jgi:transcriptional regulator with XRE-family HTH domain
MAEGADDPGVLRAGQVFAARREAIGLSQRELARQKVITQANLISFEKGRSWPREKTRAKLEKVVAWPPGTLSGLRRGVVTPESAAIDGTRSVRRDVGWLSAAPATETSAIETLPPPDTAGLVTRAVMVAVNQVLAASEKLPADDDPGFEKAAGAVLADLRELEAITARAVRGSQGSMEVIRALRLIRTRFDELMTRAAAAADATLGQRLYAARNRAALSVDEAASLLGLATDVVTAAETEQPVSPADTARIEALIAELKQA